VILGQGKADYELTSSNTRAFSEFEATKLWPGGQVIYDFDDGLQKSELK